MDRNHVWVWIVLGVALGGLGWVVRFSDFPIRRVQCVGVGGWITQASVQATVEPLMQGQNLLTVDVYAILRAVEAISWVAHAEVRRIWPDSLQVVVHEAVPVARWRNEGLLTEGARVIPTRDHRRFSDLPRLAGAVGTQGGVLELYRQAETALGPLGLRIVNLEQSVRGSWWATLSNGLSVAMGKEAVLSRWRQWIAVYQRTVASHVAQVAYVDLRYENGFAVGWKSG